MKKYILVAMMAILSLPTLAQKAEGKCGLDVKWTFDGYTLTITNINKKGFAVAIDEYDVARNIAPWVKKKFDVNRVEIGSGIYRIGSCAFANCNELKEVVFHGTDVLEIGWGAFLNCTRLRNISIPVNMKKIETIAFGNCSSLTTVKLPDHCRVEDQAFISCSGIKSLEVAPTTMLGQYVFASEVKVDDVVRHSMYDGVILRLPSYINPTNSNVYGISSAAVEKLASNRTTKVDYDYKTSAIDDVVATANYARNDTYALIIGNQNYRFVSDVPYAIHDARVFSDYCKKMLGIPSSNIHLSEDATKQMILEEELMDWLQKIPNRDKKKLIVYYAGHGVPDVKNHNKSYLLPTDVRGTSPQRGIALDDFYGKLGDLAFAQTSVFLDACFSGVNRDNEGVTEGLRGVEIEAEEGSLGNGSVVVFSAAQGNETAQGYPEEGHGLFTYYLIKEIRDSYGEVTFGTLSDNIKKNVSVKAKDLKLRKSQTPATNASESVSDSWRDFQF